MNNLRNLWMDFKIFTPEMKEYELVPFSLSLFTEEGMHKDSKLISYSSFIPLTSDTILGMKRVNLINGGCLLHEVC